MSPRHIKLLTLGTIACAVAAVTTYTGCSQGGRDTSEREAMVKQNAVETEEAEYDLLAEHEGLELKQTARKPASKTAKETPTPSATLKRTARHEVSEKSAPKDAKKALAQEPVKKQKKAEKPVDTPVEKPVAEHAAVTAPAFEKAASKPAGKRSLYVVQVGSFSVKENAEKLQGRLKAAGYPVIVHETSSAKNGVMHAVRVEPSPNKAEAQAMLKTLQEKESLAGHIVILPKN